MYNAFPESRICSSGCKPFLIRNSGSIQLGPFRSIQMGLVTFKGDGPGELVGDYEAWWSLALLSGGYWTARTFLPNIVSLPSLRSLLLPQCTYTQGYPSSAQPVSMATSCSSIFSSPSEMSLKESCPSGKCSSDTL